ncbi:hypothetical protein TNCV_4759241 [Trichonephila clavipes]|nr:hypothetical protein TNCV_4759241 [Trichonephila clavipes]
MSFAHAPQLPMVTYTGMGTETLAHMGWSHIPPYLSPWWLRGSVPEPRKPKVESSIPEGVNRFSEWENHRHACHMIMWRAKDPLSINLCLVLSVKLHYGNGLASDESMNYNLFKREIWYIARDASRW